MTLGVRRLLLWGPVLVQMAAIFYLSSLHSPPLPDHVTDKSGHFFGYALLGALMLRALARGRRRGITWQVALAAVLLSSLYGMTDEVHQAFVSGRSAEALDWIADSAGAAAAVAAGCGLAALWPVAVRQPQDGR